MVILKSENITDLYNMSLFQHSVLNKYLKEANQDEMDAAFQRLTLYFHNSEIQQNIRESKEEQFQEGFLRELFVTVFGYTINPTPDFNLTTEFKNERGAKLFKMDEMEWMEVFEIKKSEAQNLKSEIDKTDHEIDLMVYELYGLTEEEIGIVENI